MPELRLRGRRATIVAIGTVVVVVAAGATAWAVTGSSGSSYRTAVAETGNVEQTVSATGTISPVHNQNADFQVSGTVAKVKVKVGDHVKVGQVLADLDKSSLKEALRSARSTLASDKTRLTDAENGESDSVDTSSPNSSGTDGSNSFLSSTPKVVTSAQPSAEPTTSPSSRPTGFPTSGHSGGTPTGGKTGSTGGTSSSTAAIAKDQRAVRADQQAVDAALAAASAALAEVTKDCGGTTSASASSTAPSTGPSPAPSSSPPSSGGSPSGCSTAAAALLADQTMVSKDEKALSAAETTLDDALGSALSKLGGTTSKSSGKTGSSGGSHSFGNTSNTTTVSAADIASDQAAIDSARADVATAQSDLDQATLHATIAGRVSAVTVGHGDSVSGSSSSTDPAIEIVGAGQDQVSISLSATQIRNIRVGMSATVDPDGSTTARAGRVAAIDSAGTESSTGSVSYPVTVTTPQSKQLVNGAAAAVTIVVSKTSDVLTVPTSAVHRSGTSIYVEVQSGGKEVRRKVTIGAIGAVRTEISSGLARGTRVVLAKLNAAVPSSSSTLNGGTFSRRSGLGGGLGGGGGTFTITGGIPAGGSGGFPAGGFSGRSFSDNSGGGFGGN